MTKQDKNFDYILNNLEFIRGGYSGSKNGMSQNEVVYFDPEKCKYYQISYTISMESRVVNTSYTETTHKFIDKSYKEIEPTVELIRLRIDRYARKDKFYTKGKEGFPLSEKETQILFADDKFWFYDFYWKYHFRPMRTETTDCPIKDIDHYEQEEVWRE